MRDQPFVPSARTPAALPGGAADPSRGRGDLGQSPLEAVPGLGLRLLVVAALEVAQALPVCAPACHAARAPRAVGVSACAVVIAGHPDRGVRSTPARHRATTAVRNVQPSWRGGCMGCEGRPLDQPLAHAEFLVVDTETNGLAGDACELTEVGAVLVGGGELHDRWETLVGVRAPLARGIQRFTGITQAMVDEAPPAELGAARARRRSCDGRVLVAHNARFDRRVLRQAFDRAGLRWPDPPVLCTVALARRFAPARAPARAAPRWPSRSGIEVEVTHRALADAETCARVFCALFPRLCANAATVGDALALLRPRGRGAARGRDRRRRARRAARAAAARRSAPARRARRLPLPQRGGPAALRRQVDRVRTRARAHFAPSRRRRVDAAGRDRRLPDDATPSSARSCSSAA